MDMDIDTDTGHDIYEEMDMGHCIYDEMRTCTWQGHRKK